MSEYKKMCKSLSKKCNDKDLKYQYAEEEVKKYIEQSKRERLLNLKCEAKGNSFTEHFSILISGCAFLLSIVGLICNGNNSTRIFAIIICLIAVLAFIYFLLRYHYLYEWRTYILVAIKEIEKGKK